MKNLRFFNKKFDFLTIERIIEITGAKPHKECDLNSKIIDITTLESATKNDISFLNSGQYVDKFSNSKAGFCFIDEKNITKIPPTMIGLVSKNPYFSYAQIVSEFYQQKKPDFTSKTLIHPSAKIGKNVEIAPNVFIGENVEIGDNSIIFPNSSILDGVVIGANCIINSNVVITCAIIGNNCQIFNVNLSHCKSNSYKLRLQGP